MHKAGCGSCGVTTAISFPPNLLHPVVSDVFALRNAYAMGIDFCQEPSMLKVCDTHYAAT